MTNQSRFTSQFDFTTLPRFALGFDGLFEGLNRTATNLANTAYPPYNVVKVSDTAYLVEVAVAGFAEDELDIELVKGELVIKGTSKEGNPRNYVHQGIAGRNFVRTFALAENVEVKGATVKNGILAVALEVLVPEEEQAKKVAITFVK
jgi:molecular chaperone IbpA